jgi:hypothetical protein
LLQTTTIVFIPVVNVDGYISLATHFKATKDLSDHVRKNRHTYANQKDCHPSQIGVDLNRNYPFMFAADDEGSSNDPCSLLYRGPEAFSEPETRHIRDFLLAWTNIKIAVNLHAYGNLFIVPFNFDSAENLQLA